MLQTNDVDIDQDDDGLAASTMIELNGLDEAGYFEITLPPMEPGLPEEVELLRVAKLFFKVCLSLSTHF
jgi:hypothetical protein